MILGNVGSHICHRSHTMMKTTASTGSKTCTSLVQLPIEIWF